MKDNEIPILLIIFNRPDKVSKLISALSAIKPKYIYVTADGPRNETEKKKCTEAREIATTIPWECEVYTNFSDTNLGCKKGVSFGVTWFFKNVEAGIVLEDDCLPNQSFFSFCNQMLQNYKDKPQVMHINGTSFLPTLKIKADIPYYFSSITHSWGWASWRRSWDHFDGEIKNIDDLEQKWAKGNVFTNKKYSKYWIKLFRYTIEKKRNSWAVPWAYSVMYKNGVCITPSVNLVENIGFDAEATHTNNSLKFDLSTSNLSISTLKEPREISLKKDFDSAITEEIFMASFIDKVFIHLRKWYNKLT